MKAYHLWASYNQKTTNQGFPYKIILAIVKQS